MTIAKLFRRILSGLIISAMLIVSSPITSSKAQSRGRTIIRDAEIEGILAQWMEPLFEAARIDPDAVDIILVQSPQINAFVAGGANIFIYTGLINKTKNPEELIGVLAHELGHISGGHLIALRGAYDRASFESIVGAVLGLGAALLSGQGDVGSAIIAGSQGIAQRRLLAFSRVHESSADQAALRFMKDAKINANGLVSFFETLESQELLPASQQSEYMRTHPITRNRITAVQTKVDQAPGFQTRPEWVNQHARMKAKLMGFLNPQTVEWTYEKRDTSIPALYARSIAAYRTNNDKTSLKIIDQLLSKEPNNPYFQELKGQMLVDYGRVEEALPYYRRSIELLPKSGLLKIAYAHALLESKNNQKRTNEAIHLLERAIQEEPRASRIYRLLATAYGRNGNDMKARVNLAEEAVLRRNYPYARSQATYVSKQSTDKRTILQARDILAYLEHADKSR